MPFSIQKQAFSVRMHTLDTPGLRPKAMPTIFMNMPSDQSKNLYQKDVASDGYVAVLGTATEGKRKKIVEWFDDLGLDGEEIIQASITAGYVNENDFK